MTADDFRRIALSMHDAIESAHMGHPDFRANGRIFATLYASEESGTVRLPPDEQRELVRAHPEMFTPASGAWGRQGYTTVRLASAREAVVRGAMILAWQHTAASAPSSRRARPSATRQRSGPARKRRT